MEGKLFLGIADNDRFASIVVGDENGRIIASGIGGSVNYHCWGTEVAKDNLRGLVHQTIGWHNREKIFRICFTYKSEFRVSEWKITDLVSDFPGCTRPTIVDFAKGSLLGMCGGKERLLLVGGHSGLVIFEDISGKQLMMRQKTPTWNPIMRLNKKLKEVYEVGCGRCEEDLLHIKYYLDLGRSSSDITGLLDQLVDKGRPAVIELAYDLAYDLVQLVVNISPHFNVFDLVIGLYGQLLLESRAIKERVCHLLHLLFPACQIVDMPLAPAKGAYFSSVLVKKPRVKHEIVHDVLV